MLYLNGGFMNFKKIAFMMLCGIFFSGCGFGHMVSKTERFSSHESIMLNSDRSDILDIIAEVGESIGYKLSEIDKQNKQVSLISQSSTGNLLIGSAHYNKITFTVKSEDKLIDMNILLQGNFSSASKEEADKLYEEFKTKISERLKK